MTRRRLLGVMGAVAALLLAGATYHVLTRPEWSTDGPAKVPNPHGYIVRYHVGQVFTDGLEIVELTGHRTGVLRKVELSGPSMDHFKVLGLLVAGQHRTIGSWEVSKGFPPRQPRLGKLMPAVGARLPPGKLGTVLLIGLKVVKPGLGLRTRVTVYYTVGSHKYVVKFPASIVNCPSSMTDDQCFNTFPT